LKLMATGRLSQPQINAFNTWLDSIVADYRSEWDEDDPVEYFRERYMDVLADVDQGQSRFLSNERRTLGTLSNLVTQIITSIEDATASISSGVREEEATSLVRRVIPLLNKVPGVRQSVQNLVRGANRAYDSGCRGVYELAAEFGFGVPGGAVDTMEEEEEEEEEESQAERDAEDADEIVSQFEALEPFVAHSRIIGDVIVRPDDFVRAYGRDGLVDLVRQKLGARSLPALLATRAPAPYQEMRARVDALRERCLTGPARMVAETQGAVERVLNEADSQVQAATAQLVEAANERRFHSSGPVGRALRALSDALKSALGIDVQVQTEAADTSLDPYYARLHEACQNPLFADRRELIELASIVGVPRSVLEALDARGICEVALGRRW
jgi:hypothetical protein